MGVYSSIELIDVVVGFGKALIGGCCPLVYHGDEAEGDSMCSVLEVATLIHVEDCFGQSEGYWWVVPLRVWGDTYMEQGWRCNLLHR